MIQKKVCLLGLAGVGKTSLVHRLVYRAWSDRYLATLGVRIEKRDLVVADRAIRLFFWDVEGQHPEQVRGAVLRGASAYLLVADGTRAATLDAAVALQARVREASAHPLPCLLLVNKVDLADAWAINDAALASLRGGGWSVWCTSAKTGQDVEAAISDLARTLLTPPVR